LASTTDEADGALTLQGQLFGADRAHAAARAGELIELVGLSGAVNRRAGTYSGGMRRRLDLALALVHQPMSSSSTSRQPGWTPPAGGTSGRRYGG